MKMPIQAISSRINQLLFSFLLFAGLALPATALEVDDLYIADVLVADESASQLRAGARAGLLQVLVRVSGKTDIDDNPLIRASLRRPADYYYQFSYESTDKKLMTADGEQEARILTLHFEPSAVARLLREAELPVWGSNRPLVILWVAVNEGADRRILGESDETELAEALAEQARRRGLPVMFPILDLEDAARISSAEVWGAFLDRIELASSRYQPDAILTARVQQEISGRWSGKWSFRTEDTWKSVDNVAFSPDQLVRTMVDQLADDLAEQYAFGSARDVIALTVEGVTSVQDYAAVSAYLETLAPVVHSSIVSLSGDVAKFDLRIEGQQQQLIDLIELDQRMLLLTNNPRSDQLLYRWKSS
jgi:hypothetical protein